MMRAYLFIYNAQVGSQEEVKEYLNRMTLVSHWRFDMPNVFYVLSESSAEQLAKEFEGLAGTKGRFIFLEYSTNSQGRLTSETWYLLSNKQKKPK